MRQTNAYKILQRLIDGTVLKPEHREIVKRWLISDNDADEKEMAMQQIWAETYATETDEKIQESLNATQKKIRKGEDFILPKKRSFIIQLCRYAAILMLPILSALGTWFVIEKNNSDMELVECYVPNKEQRTIELSDGSHVQMNAGTTLIYPQKFNGKNRTVYLSGEAVFSVTPNTQKPFIVHTGPLMVEVLGTKFNVDAYNGSGYIATTLEEGSVKIYRTENPQEEILVAPNEQLTYMRQEDSFTKMKVETSDYTAWTHGELRFNNKSLNEILVTLERYYDVHFQVDQNINCTDVYTVKFKSHETIDDVMHIFTQLVDNITYRREEQTIRLSQKRKGVIP